MFTALESSFTNGHSKKKLWLRTHILHGREAKELAMTEQANA